MTMTAAQVLEKKRKRDKAIAGQGTLTGGGMPGMPGMPGGGMPGMPGGGMPGGGMGMPGGGMPGGGMPGGGMPGGGTGMPGGGMPGGGMDMPGGGMDMPGGGMDMPGGGMPGGGMGMPGGQGVPSGMDVAGGPGGMGTLTGGGMLGGGMGGMGGMQEANGPAAGSYSPDQGGGMPQMPEMPGGDQMPGGGKKPGAPQVGGAMGTLMGELKPQGMMQAPGGGEMPSQSDMQASMPTMPKGPAGSNAANRGKMMQQMESAQAQTGAGMDQPMMPPLGGPGMEGQQTGGSGMQVSGQGTLTGGQQQVGTGGVDGPKPGHTRKYDQWGGWRDLDASGNEVSRGVGHGKGTGSANDPHRPNRKAGESKEEYDNKKYGGTLEERKKRAADMGKNPWQFDSGPKLTTEQKADQEKWNKGSKLISQRSRYQQKQDQARRSYDTSKKAYDRAWGSEEGWKKHLAAGGDPRGRETAKRNLETAQKNLDTWTKARNEAESSLKESGIDYRKPRGDSPQVAAGKKWREKVGHPQSPGEGFEWKNTGDVRMWYRPKSEQAEAGETGQAGQAGAGTLTGGQGGQAGQAGQAGAVEDKYEPVPGRPGVVRLKAGAGAWKTDAGWADTEKEWGGKQLGSAAGRAKYDPGPGKTDFEKGMSKIAQDLSYDGKKLARELGLSSREADIMQEFLDVERNPRGEGGSKAYKNSRSEMQRMERSQRERILSAWSAGGFGGTGTAMAGREGVGSGAGTLTGGQGGFGAGTGATTSGDPGQQSTPIWGREEIIGGGTGGQGGQGGQQPQFNAQFSPDITTNVNVEAQQLPGTSFVPGQGGAGYNQFRGLPGTEERDITSQTPMDAGVQQEEIGGESPMALADLTRAAGGIIGGQGGQAGSTIGSMSPMAAPSGGLSGFGYSSGIAPPGQGRSAPGVHAPNNPYVNMARMGGQGSMRAFEWDDMARANPSLFQGVSPQQWQAQEPWGTQGAQAAEQLGMGGFAPSSTSRGFMGDVPPREPGETRDEKRAKKDAEKAAEKARKDLEDKYDIDTSQLSPEERVYYEYQKAQDEHRLATQERQKRIEEVYGKLEGKSEALEAERREYSEGLEGRMGQREASNLAKIAGLTGSERDRFLEQMTGERGGITERIGAMKGEEQERYKTLAARMKNMTEGQKKELLGQLAGRREDIVGQLGKREADIDKRFGDRLSKGLSMREGMGDEEKKEIRRRFADRLKQGEAKAEQGLLSRGLGGTTIRSSVLGGMQSRSAREEEAALDRVTAEVRRGNVAAFQQMSGDQLTAAQNASMAKIQAGKELTGDEARALSAINQEIGARESQMGMAGAGALQGINRMAAGQQASLGAQGLAGTQALGAQGLGAGFGTMAAGMQGDTQRGLAEMSNRIAMGDRSAQTVQRFADFLERITNVPPDQNMMAQLMNQLGAGGYGYQGGTTPIGIGGGGQVPQFPNPPQPQPPQPQPQPQPQPENPFDVEPEKPKPKPKPDFPQEFPDDDFPQTFPGDDDIPIVLDPDDKTTPKPGDPTPTPKPGDPTPKPGDPTPKPGDPTPKPGDPTPKPGEPVPPPGDPDPDDPAWQEYYEDYEEWMASQNLADSEPFGGSPYTPGNPQPPGTPPGPSPVPPRPPGGPSSPVPDPAGVVHPSGLVAPGLLPGPDKPSPLTRPVDPLGAAQTPGTQPPPESGDHVGQIKNNHYWDGEKWVPQAQGRGLTG